MNGQDTNDLSNLLGRRYVIPIDPFPINERWRALDIAENSEKHRVFHNQFNRPASTIDKATRGSTNGTSVDKHVSKEGSQ